jgi:hypothetical protein
MSPSFSIQRQRSASTWRNSTTQCTTIACSALERTSNFEYLDSVSLTLASMPVYVWPKRVAGPRKEYLHGPLFSALIAVAREYAAAETDLRLYLDPSACALRGLSFLWGAGGPHGPTRRGSGDPPHQGHWGREEAKRERRIAQHKRKKEGATTHATTLA